MVLDKCTICGKAATNKCSRCKSAAYCSVDCQRTDQPLHKLLCNQYLNFLQTRPVATDDDKQPGDVLPPKYKLALLFPAKADHPQLIWVKVQIRSEHDEEDSEEENPTYDYWQWCTEDLSNYMKFPRAMNHTRNGQDLDIYMGESCFGEDPITQSLLTLNAGYRSSEYGSLHPTPWAGNLIVFNMTKELLQHPKYGEHDKELHNDATLSDLRYAFDYLTRNNYIFEATQPNPYVIRKEGRWFKAVKVSCSGDMVFEGKKKYVEVAISRYHPIFTQGNDGKSSISTHLGFPLLVKKICPNPNWVDRMNKLPKESRFSPYENPEMCIMINVEVQSKHWRCLEEQWDKGLDPTVLVARQDMKDLTTHQVEALVHYSREVLEDEMGHVSLREMEQDPNAEDAYYSDYDEADIEAHIPSQKVRKEFLEEYLLSNKFAEFFEEFKQTKLAGGDMTWADATFPAKGFVADEEKIETEEDKVEALMRIWGLL
jgi:hypothetical protein